MPMRSTRLPQSSAFSSLTYSTRPRRTRRPRNDSETLPGPIALSSAPMSVVFPTFGSDQIRDVPPLYRKPSKIARSSYDLRGSLEAGPASAKARPRDGRAAAGQRLGHLAEAPQEFVGRHP